MRVRRHADVLPGDEHLLAGAHYTVFAWRYGQDGVSYAVVDGRGDGIPRWAPGWLFELVDRRPSRYWRVRVDDGPPHGPGALFAVEPWADDPGFHGDLLDGDEYALETFRGFRRLMEREFPDPGVALHGERGARAPWVRCPACGHEFVIHTEQGMIRCPECKAPMHSPW